VTAGEGPARGVLAWLTAQAVVFGAMAALLGIVANAMFLDAYGAAWLPATYVAIGAAGIVVSGAVARSAQRFDLVGIALVVLGGAAVALGVAWLLAGDGSAPWVSIPLLVGFPILIQLGFVFIGGQAGRLLDIAGIKASFPRIVTGFPVGAVAGGVLGGQLVTALGRTEVLLLAAALAQAAFAGLVWATGRRYAARLRAILEPVTPGDGAPDAGVEHLSLRRLLASRFIALILAYQVLSAVGSQLADYLVYDRASARFLDPEDLARFLAGYTAAMNVASIAFLFLVAGPLLRRFGLRPGITANPFVLGGFAVAMLAVWAVAGPASTALLFTVSAARIADVALTDGTTRTSINVTYQALPERARLAVQTAVEGIGVPVAIGASGVLIIVLNVLRSPLGATLAVTAIVCLAWSWGAVLLYRAYGPALVHALRRRRVLGEPSRWAATSDDEAAVRRLLASPDGRATRLGVDLLASMGSPALDVELLALRDDPRPEVRIAALEGRAARGEESARRLLADAVRDGLASPDPAARVAALEAVAAGDAFALIPALDALSDSGTAAAAAGALDRLGDLPLPALADRLAAARTPADAAVSRLVRALATSTEAREALLRNHVGHPDRELGLVVIERLVVREPAGAGTAAALDHVRAEDVAHARRILTALELVAEARGESGGSGLEPLRRALADELDLIRARVAAGRLARYGSLAIGPAIVALRAGGTGVAVAAEALGVLLHSDESRHVLPILEPDRAPGERLRRLGRHPGSWRGLDDCLADIVEDHGDAWRSPWLRACAVYAAVRRSGLAHLDLEPARALHDPAIDELLPAG
jgi:hypothetical protein